MKPSRIRELGRRYAAGEISLDEYRAQRRKLIDGVTAGLLKLEYGEISVVHGKQSWRLLVYGSALLVIAIGIGIIVHMEYSHQASRSNPQSKIAFDTGPAVLQSFVETNDWSDASLVQFIQRWKALPAREQNAAVGDYLFPRLLAQLHEQIVSQRVVVDLAAGDKNAADQAAVHLAHLQQLATMLDVKPEN